MSSVYLSIQMHIVNVLIGCFVYSTISHVQIIDIITVLTMLFFGKFSHKIIFFASECEFFINISNQYS